MCTMQAERESERAFWSIKQLKCNFYMHTAADSEGAWADLLEVIGKWYGN